MALIEGVDYSNAMDHNEHDGSMGSTAPPPYEDPLCFHCGEICPCSTQPVRLQMSGVSNGRAVSPRPETATSSEKEASLTVQDIFQQAEEKCRPEFRKWERQWLYQGAKFDEQYKDCSFYKEFKLWQALWHKVDIGQRVAQDPFRLHQYMYMAGSNDGRGTCWHWRASKKPESPFFQEWEEWVAVLRLKGFEAVHAIEYMTKTRPAFSRTWEACV
ncbi:hypothetical protein BT63DRAFT_484097 [Microthyrium microscopicum]|uniref:Uncharacterized protein n=1 Tax=Microthyrium microscopicum TaxID=703497 RepID=A0A6A6TW26_9PEZI|nr:hypothetical protein BT63DRAFT_484097 [Microthyrium microscopicum]